MTDIILNDNASQELLSRAKVIAVVGHSDNPSRTSYRIAQYLRSVGYMVYPVNPTVDTIDGERSYPSLADVPQPIDIVNVFRRSEYVAGIVDEAIELNLPAIWTQLGVVDEQAAARAAEHGIAMVMNRCIKVEHNRLIAVEY